MDSVSFINRKSQSSNTKLVQKLQYLLTHPSLVAQDKVKLETYHLGTGRFLNKLILNCNAGVFLSVFYSFMHIHI